MYDLLIPLLAATVQSGTPILYATLGEMLTERSGVLNLGVEGLMMMGAVCAFLAATVTGSPVIGFLAGGAAGSALAAVHGLVCLVFMGNQVVSGLALTILGVGLANFLGTPYVGQQTVGFSPMLIPVLSDLPVVGPAFFRHDPLVYLSYLLAPAYWFLWRRTRWGLAIEAVGEHPRAAAAAGLNPMACRWAGVLGGGFLCGLGGAYLPMAYTNLWTNGLTAGRGWIAVALVIFAFWRPFRAVLGAYLFGGVMAFQLRLQATGAALPSSLLLMLPYLMTILALAASSLRDGGRRGRAPAALGVTLEPEG